VTQPATELDRSSSTAPPPGQDVRVERAEVRPRLDLSLPHVDGFDGIRGVFLVVILLGHHGWHRIPGALFTVSMFFTLSGYLIATLMLAEWGRTGRVSLARFWERRARRLLPAAFAAVAFVAVLEWWFGVGGGPRFRGDLLSALGYVANWRMASSGTDYAANFLMESPVQHFWSLAIEEQFYLTFPLLFVGVMRLARQRWGAVGVVCGVLAVASFVAAWVSSARHGNLGITYYATYTRASEILVGVTLAFVLAAPAVRRFLASDRGVRLAAGGAVVAAVGYGWLITNVGLDHPFTFRGGTILNALCTALIVVACTSPRPGLVVRGLCLAPFRYLGMATYGIYLFHLPVYMLLDGERTGLGFWPLFVVRVAAMAVPVLISYHLLESPFRFRLPMPRRRLALVLGVPGALVALIVLVVPVSTAHTVDLAGAAEQDHPLVPDAVVPVDGAEPAARVLLVGDSITWTMFVGLEAWNRDHPDAQVHVDAHFAVACPLAEPGPVRFLGRIEEPFESCRRLRPELPDTLAGADYDAIVVTLGGKDLSDREVAGAWRHPGDPVFDEWLRPQIRELADVVATEGVPVFWSEVAHVRMARPNDPTSDWRDYPDNDPARVDRMNELYREEIEGRPGFTLLPVDQWLHGLPGGEFNREYRGDGVHFTEKGSEAFAAWLVPQILEAVEGGGPAVAPTRSGG